MNDITLELIESISEMLSAKTYPKDWVKERLTNLASIASLDGEIKQLNQSRNLPTEINEQN